MIDVACGCFHATSGMGQHRQACITLKILIILETEQSNRHGTAEASLHYPQILIVLETEQSYSHGRQAAPQAHEGTMHCLSNHAQGATPDMQV